MPRAVYLLVVLILAACWLPAVWLEGKEHHVRTEALEIVLLLICEIIVSLAYLATKRWQERKR
jgi:Zn-dependent protease with chaperone function